MTHHSLHQNIGRLHPFEPLEVQGDLPEDLHGVLVRTGPGLPERFGVRVPHVFLADGVLSALRFDGAGAALGATRAVQSDAFLEEEAAGRRLFGPSVPLWRRWLRGPAGRRPKNTGNTSVYAIGDRIFAQVESSRPLEIDPETLAVRGEVDFEGVLGRSFSAHPHRVPSLGTTFNFGVRWGRVSYLDVYAVPDRGPARRLTEVAMPWGSFVHDFAVTETHLVFLIPPMKVRPLPAMLGIGGFTNWFAWRPELGTRALIVPLDAPEQVEQVDLPPFWFFHVGATGRRGDELFVDVVASPDNAVVSALGTDRTATPPVYSRVRLPLAGGHGSIAPVWDQGCEFPRVHPKHEGSGPAACWVGCRGGGVARLDLEDGDHDVWAPPSDLRCSEPVMVPRSGGETDGYVLSLAHDGNTDESFTLVFDAGQIADGPRARIRWGQTLPTTYHGCFIPR